MSGGRGGLAVATTDVQRDKGDNSNSHKRAEDRNGDDCALAQAASPSPTRLSILGVVARRSTRVLGRATATRRRRARSDAEAGRFRLGDGLADSGDDFVLRSLAVVVENGGGGSDIGEGSVVAFVFHGGGQRLGRFAEDAGLETDAGGEGLGTGGAEVCRLLLFISILKALVVGGLSVPA